MGRKKMTKISYYQTNNSYSNFFDHLIYWQNGFISYKIKTYKNRGYTPNIKVILQKLIFPKSCSNIKTND